MCIKRVLLVDDDPQIRKITEIALCRIGKWTVRLAESGPAALAVATEFRPDLVLLDVMMPGMDGFTTFDLLRQRSDFCSTPVIFMTAKVQQHEVKSYFDAGAAGVIVKPFDPLKLPDEILRIVGRLGAVRCAD